jgi:hypothetical protein
VSPSLPSFGQEVKRVWPALLWNLPATLSEA